MLNDKKVLEFVCMFTNVVADRNPVETFGIYIDVFESETRNIEDSFLTITNTLEDYCIDNNVNLLECDIIIDSIVIYGRYLPSRFRAEIVGDRDTLVDNCNIAISKIVNALSKDIKVYGTL